VTTVQSSSQTDRGFQGIRIVVCVLLLCQILICIAGAKRSLSGMVDFRSFYAAGAIVRSGHGPQLYDYDYQQQVQTALVSPRAGALPFLYPAFAALPFVPLSLVSYKAAFFILLAVNLGFLLLASFLLRPWLPRFRERSRIVLPMLYGCLFGVSVALMQGQISFVLLAVYCGSWVLLQTERRFLAGALMSIGMMKFQIAIPIFLLFCFWRQWRFMAGFLAGSIGLGGISAAIVGKVGLIAYWDSMTGLTRQTAFNAAAAKARYGMFPADMPNLHGLAFGVTHGAAWGLILNIVLCCATLFFAARQRASLLVALPAAMLVSYHMQPHDLTLLLLPLSFIADALFQRLQRRRGGDHQAIRFYETTLLFSLLLLVLPLAYMVLAWGMNYLVSLAVCAAMVSAARINAESTDNTSAAILGAA
jgi:Glycosyltransferase family 87